MLIRNNYFLLRKFFHLYNSNFILIRYKYVSLELIIVFTEMIGEEFVSSLLKIRYVKL